MRVLGLCSSDPVIEIAGHHYPAFVVVAYLTVTLASFAALEMTERLGRAGPRARPFWLSGAALALGGGIWSTHFIAMLAYAGPLPIHYDAGKTFYSGAVAIAGAAAGLAILGKGGYRRILGGGVLVGLSIGLMHHLAMGAMPMPGQIYRPGLFTVLIMIAIAAASIVLWLATTLRTTPQRAVAALAMTMALAICGMHFTAIAGAGIAPDVLAAAGQTAGPVFGSLLAAAVVVVLAMILIVGVTCAYFDRRIEARDAGEADRSRALNETLEVRVRQRTTDLTEALTALDEQRLRAEAASRAKSDFLANMSHELRTPLNAVIGFAELLLMQSEQSGLAPKQCEAVNHIATAGRNLLALIEDVLDFAKIESGKVTVSLAAVDPMAIIEDLATSFRFDLERAQIALRITPPENIVAVRADPLRLKQVLANLVSNAIKYNRPGGEVIVTVAFNTKTVAVSVHDTGLGIPAERLSSLFEPFNRLGREALTIQGAGLGLALTKRLVEAMEGELTVETTADVGSTFTVRLLVSQLAETAAAESQLEPLLVRGGRPALVLYIEDNESNIRLMRHLAEAIGGFELHVAEHPRDGLQAAQHLQPDLILLDINLPDMDGFEVKARLNANPATAAIPVIALSANVLSETMSRGRSAGFHGYLTKPLNIPELLEAISQAVREPPEVDLPPGRVDGLGRSTSAGLM